MATSTCDDKSVLAGSMKSAAAEGRTAGESISGFGVFFGVEKISSEKLTSISIEGFFSNAVYSAQGYKRSLNGLAASSSEYSSSTSLIS